MDVRVETHKRYEIKSGRVGGGWTARAFRRKTVVGQAVAGSRDEAVAALIAELDRLDAIDLSERDEEGVPSAARYQDAFLAVLPSLPESYRAMLKAHLAAPDHLISATKLAEAAGYSGYEGANLHYGLLAQRLAHEIGFTPPKRDDGTDIWTSAIASEPPPDADIPREAAMEDAARRRASDHFEWRMRPQVVQALRALGF